MRGAHESVVGSPAVELPARKAMRKANAEFYCKPSPALNTQCPRASKAKKPLARRSARLARQPLAAIPVPNAPDLFCPEVHAPRGGARDRPRCATIARPNAVTAGSMAARTATVVQPTSCRQGATRRPSRVEATLRRERNCNLACTYGCPPEAKIKRSAPEPRRARSVRPLRPSGAAA